MKLLITGDVHLRAKKMEDISAAWSKVVAFANKNQVDLICQAGDVFDTSNVFGREASVGSVYEAFLAPFFEHENPVPFFGIVGNHDLASAKDKDALSPIDRYKFMTIVRKPSVVHINDQLAICAVPWLNKAHLVAKLMQGGAKAKDATKRVHEAVLNLMNPLAKEVAAAKAAGKFVLFMGHLEVTGAKREGGTVQSGGCFEFTPLELSSVGADAYALAHIHVRQSIPNLPNSNDGYIGALTQLSFGEEGQQVGCRLIETDGRKMVSDKWLDNKVSPKYFNCSSLEGVQYRPGVDYVKLRGDVRPESLPDGVIFEKLPALGETKRRTEQKLECTSSLRTLLEAWKTKENCDIPLEMLVEQAELIRSQNQIQSEAIGSLERIESIKVEKLTCHGETEILTDFDGICAIAGANGSGKSTAIETICLAPYGLSPRKLGFKSLLPKGDSVDAASELCFLSSGKKYRVRREFTKRKKTVSQSAYLFLDGKSEALAGPNLGDVHKQCCDLIGDPALVMAGIFSSQGDESNVTNLDRAPRMDLFAKLLGTQQFLSYSEAAKKLCSADVAVVSAKMARLETIKNELANEKRERDSFETITASISHCEKNKAEVARALEASRKQDEEIKDRQREHIRSMNEKVGHEGEMVRISTEAKTLKTKKADLLAGIDENHDAELTEARKDKDTIQSLNEQIAEALAARMETLSQASEAKSKASAMLSDHTSRFEAAWRSASAKLNEEKAKLAESVKDIMIKIGQVEGKRDSVLKSIEGAKRQSSLLSDPGFPDLKECKTCPLAKDIISIRDGIIAMQEEASKLEATLQKGNDKLKKMREDGQAAIDKMTLPKKEEFEPETVKAAKELVDQAASIEASAPQEPSSLVAKKKQLEASAARIPVLEEKIASVQQRKDEAQKIDARIDSLRTSYKEIDQKIKALVVSPAPSVEEMTAVSKSLGDAQLRLQSFDGEMKKLNVDLGRQTAVLTSMTKLKKEMEDIDADTKDKRQRVDVLTGLCKAFSRDGIPQLIVDSAIPHLNDIIFGLLSECDGRWSMRVSSFKEDLKGKVSESIDVLVDDGEDERDISTYSGGERNLLEYVFRVAFSILQSERSGKGLKVLALDEPMYFADETLADAFMRMIKKLTSHFNQIFIISHSDHILSSIDNKIYFTRTPKGESVVQCDFPERKVIA